MLRAITAVLLTAFMLVAAPARAEDSWSRYAYPEAGFSAEFPVKPTFSIDTDTTGPATDRRLYVVDQTSKAFIVMSARAPTMTLSDLRTVVGLVSGRDGRVLTSQMTVTLEGEEGLESLITTRDGSRILHRIFYHDGRLLQFIVAVEASEDPETVGRPFNDSTRFAGPDI